MNNEYLLNTSKDSAYSKKIQYLIITAQCILVVINYVRPAPRIIPYLLSMIFENSKTFLELFGQILDTIKRATLYGNLKTYLFGKVNLGMKFYP